LLWLIASAVIFTACYSRANIHEVDWTSSGFSTSLITINVGDEIDYVNFDDTFDLLLTGNRPGGFSADVPAFDGIDLYYVPIIYNTAGTFSSSDEFGDSMTIVVNQIVVTPLSVAITDPTNNAVFSQLNNFNVTAVPAGGASPYQVEFFVGTNSQGVVSSSPFTVTISNLAVGNYTISAIATDNNLNTATNSIVVSVGPPVVTNNILPAACADIYSSGTVLTGSTLDSASNIHGGLQFASFNAKQYSSILLELNPYGLPLFGPDVSVYGFDGGNGIFYGSNFNSGTLIGVWTLPAGLNYGQVATYDVTSFVKSTKGPYFGFILVAAGDSFSSTSQNYGTPPMLYAVGPPLLAATRAGNQMIVSWPTNTPPALSLETSTNGITGSWMSVTQSPAVVGTQWAVTNSVSVRSQFFRLRSH
jgi:hypothetical protein